MNRSLLATGILLSLGLVGCSGFGVQQGTSLVADNASQPGLDDLWDESRSPEHAAEGVEIQDEKAPRYAKQDLGTLWDDRHSDDGITKTTYRDRSADLWTPSSAKVEPKPGSKERRSRSYLFSAAPRGLSY